MWHRAIGFDLRFRRKERSYKSVQLFTHFSIFRLVKTGFQSCFNLNISAIFLPTRLSRLVIAYFFHFLKSGSLI